MYWPCNANVSLALHFGPVLGCPMTGTKAWINLAGVSEITAGLRKSASGTPNIKVQKIYMKNHLHVSEGLLACVGVYGCAHTHSTGEGRHIPIYTHFMLMQACPLL